MSVIIPAFDAAEHLNQTLKSLRTQTFKDLEIIVVDDGSTDGTRAIAEQHPGVVVLHRPHGGPAAARQTGVEHARGEYLAFCDADDPQLPWRIEAQVYLLDRCPNAALVAGDVSEYSKGTVAHEHALRRYWLGPVDQPFDRALEEGFRTWSTCAQRGVPVPENYAERRVYQGYVSRLVATMHLCWGGASLVRRSAYDAVGGFDQTVTPFEDWHLVARLSKRFELVFLDVPLILYRRHGAQHTTKVPLHSEGFMRVIEDAWMSDPRYYEAHADVIDRARSAAHYMAGVEALRSKRWAAAADNFARSVFARPAQKRAYLYLLEASLKKRVPWNLRASLVG